MDAWATCEQIYKRKQIIVTKREGVPLEQNFADWLPAVALFLFVSYQCLRDVVSSAVGSYGAAVYLLVSISYVLLFVYALNRASQIAVARFIVPPVAFIVIFGFYILSAGAGGFIFEKQALPLFLNPMGGFLGYLFMVFQNQCERANTAFKASTLVMSVYLQVSLSTVMHETSDVGYSMALGYSALFFALLSFHFLFDEKGQFGFFSKLIWMICAISNIILLIAYGSRGPLIGLVVYATFRFIVYISLSRRTTFQTKIVISVIILVLLAALAFYLNELATYLNSQLNSFGVYSRTLERYLNSTVNSDSGRSLIWGKLIPRISLFGNGPFSDQHLLGPAVYAHNFALEVVYDFGVLFGLTALTIFTWLNAKVLYRFSDTAWRSLYVVFASYCLARLALSGTFWTETYFWMFIGLIVLCLSHQTHIDKNNASRIKIRQRKVG